MKTPPFRLHRPTTIEDAISLAADFENRNQGFDWVSGGTDLLANYKWHINTKPHVISLASIEELTHHDRYHIGAMVRLHDLEHGPAHALLKKAAGTIASTLIRRTATVGGNLCLDTRCFWYNQTEDWRRSIDWCHKEDCGTGSDCRVIPNQNTLCVATYQGDLAPSLMVLEGTIHIIGPNGPRSLLVEDFFQLDGITRNVLEHGEFVLKVTFPKGHIGTVGATFNHIQGDLDLLLYDANGKFLGNRLWQGGPENYPANYRGNESNYEFLSVMNQDQDVTAYFKVQGFSGAQNSYTLETSSTEWKDGPLCTTYYSEAECAGYTGAQAGNLKQFPHPSATDPYVPNGYIFDSYGSYRWMRRELIMLVRHGIHEVQQQFNGTTALGLIDMCDKEGITPGFDVGSPRHPESTHDQGGNIDIAYYQTDGNNSAESVCGPNNTANDGYFCTNINNHIMDVPRTTFFMVVLSNHPRIRVIGVDTLLAPLIQQQAQTFKNQGVITQTEYNNLIKHMAYGEGWPFHHHHMHVSMKWWSQGVGNGFFVPKDPPVGCGFRMPGDGPLPMKKGDFHPHH